MRCIKKEKEKTMKRTELRRNTMKKATNTIRQRHSLLISFILAIVLIGAAFYSINMIAKQLYKQIESAKEEEISKQQEVNYAEYSNIRRTISSDERRELQQMLREMSYTDVIPSTGYKEFNRFMCRLYTCESEKGTVEIFVNPKREALIQLHKDDDVHIVDIIDNIDYMIGRTVPNASIVFHDTTWVADENGMNKWEFGKRTLISEESFKQYENTELSIIRNKIIVSSGNRILELDEDKCVEILTDCRDGQYKFFNHSLFYINLNYDLVEYNILTGEKTQIDSEVYSIGGEIRVKYKVINDLEDRFIPGYIDEEGNRRRFTDYEIDENLIMTVSK